MKKIAWEKIEDEDSNVESDLIDKQSLQEFLEEESEDSHGGFSFELLPPSKIKTPFGNYEFDDPFSAYKMFDCWICHTNFPITTLEALIIDEQVEGIGAFKVLSKYRFCLGIEKLFSIAEVRESVHKLLCGDDEVSKEARRLDSIVSKINNHDSWAIFIGDGGNIVSSSIDNDGDQHKTNLASMKKLKNGRLIVCDKK